MANNTTGRRFDDRYEYFYRDYQPEKIPKRDVSDEGRKFREARRKVEAKLEERQRRRDEADFLDLLSGS